MPQSGEIAVVLKLYKRKFRGWPQASAGVRLARSRGFIETLLNKNMEGFQDLSDSGENQEPGDPLPKPPAFVNTGRPIRGPGFVGGRGMEEMEPKGEAPARKAREDSSC